MSVPSVKSIEKFFGQQFRHDYSTVSGPAKQLRVHLEDLADAERRGDSRMWRKASDAVDKLLGGSGWQFVAVGGREVAYLNMGDTYAGTVLVYPSGTIKLGTWGDFVESHSR